MTAIPTAPAHPPPTPAAEEKGGRPRFGRIVVYLAAGLGVLALAAGAVWVTAYWIANPDQAAVWRDIFIILMAVESLFIGLALTVLIVQLAVLTNMLKNEIKPILESTNETVNTVRGTAVFVSDNLVEPIVKLNSYVAGISRALEVLGALAQLGRRK